MYKKCQFLLFTIFRFKFHYVMSKIYQYLKWKCQYSVFFNFSQRVFMFVMRFSKYKTNLKPKKNCANINKENANTANLCVASQWTGRLNHYKSTYNCNSAINYDGRLHFFFGTKIQMNLFNMCVVFISLNALEGDMEHEVTIEKTR